MIAIRISVAGYDLILNGYVNLKALKLIFCSLFAAFCYWIIAMQWTFCLIFIIFNYYFHFCSNLCRWIMARSIYLSLICLLALLWEFLRFFFRHNIIQYNYIRVITSEFIQKQNLLSWLKEQSKMANGLK